MVKIPIAIIALTFILSSILLMILALILKIWPLVIIFSLLTVFFIFFFRDPERKIMARPGCLLSPADGKIVAIKKGTSIHKVSIFLSLLDVHIVRSPLEGTIVALEKRSGKKLPASKEEASRLNQALTLTIKNQHEEIELKMIVGIAARRIRSFVQLGDKVKAGERIGLMAFGSRAEVSFPAIYSLKVVCNQKVKGGLTILAEKEPGKSCPLGEN